VRGSRVGRAAYTLEQAALEAVRASADDGDEAMWARWKTSSMCS
jgi:hypothetical protein